MPATCATDQIAVADCVAAWQCAPTGFAHASPLNGQRGIVAVGAVAVSDESAALVEDARSAMSSTLLDVALIEGHDPAALLDRANAELDAAGVGRLDALALISSGGEGLVPTVAGVGDPLPLVVTADHLSAPASGWVALSPGWVVVLGTRTGHPRAVSGAGRSEDLLAPADIRAALRFFGPDREPSTPRTLLAVAYESPDVTN